MKIEKNDLFNQQVQNEKPFEKASVTTSFSETVKAKTDALEQSVRTGLTGYSKEEVKAKSAMEELEAKIGNQMDAAALSQKSLQFPLLDSPQKLRPLGLLITAPVCQRID